ncbi:MAG: hypothetical protein ACYCQI_03940 [Gammaproteobacteria bacterium]
MELKKIPQTFTNAPLIYELDSYITSLQHKAHDPAKVEFLTAQVTKNKEPKDPEFKHPTLEDYKRVNPAIVSDAAQATIRAVAADLKGREDKKPIPKDLKDAMSPLMKASGAIFTSMLKNSYNTAQKDLKEYQSPEFRKKYTDAEWNKIEAEVDGVKVPVKNYEQKIADYKKFIIEDETGKLKEFNDLDLLLEFERLEKAVITAKTNNEALVALKAYDDFMQRSGVMDTKKLYALKTEKLYDLKTLINSFQALVDPTPYVIKCLANKDKWGADYRYIDPASTHYRILDSKKDDILAAAIMDAIQERKKTFDYSALNKAKDEIAKFRREFKQGSPEMEAAEAKFDVIQEEYKKILGRISTEIVDSIPALQSLEAKEKESVINKVMMCFYDSKKTFKHKFTSEIDIGLLALLVPPAPKNFQSKSDAIPKLEDVKQEPAGAGPKMDVKQSEPLSSGPRKQSIASGRHVAFGESEPGSRPRRVTLNQDSRQGTFSRQSTAPSGSIIGMGMGRLESKSTVGSPSPASGRASGVYTTSHGQTDREVYVQFFINAVLDKKESPTFAAVYADAGTAAGLKWKQENSGEINESALQAVARDSFKEYEAARKDKEYREKYLTSENGKNKVRLILGGYLREAEEKRLSEKFSQEGLSESQVKDKVAEIIMSEVNKAVDKIIKDPGNALLVKAQNEYLESVPSRRGTMATPSKRASATTASSTALLGFYSKPPNKVDVGKAGHKKGVLSNIGEVVPGVVDSDSDKDDDKDKAKANEASELSRRR